MAPVDLLIGPLIQCMEAATLGMPFEVWKTRMGSNRTEGTLEAFKNIYRKGGPQGVLGRNRSEDDRVRE
jgi:hypothetical protein